jgi:UDPglucose 6-dehydrogenase
MPRAFSAIADSDESPSTAPTTPDGSLSFSPVLQAAQLLDAFDGAAGVQSRPGRGSSATLDLDGTIPMVVKNICCVGAGYVGELQSNYVSFALPLQRKIRFLAVCVKKCAEGMPALKPRERHFLS